MYHLRIKTRADWRIYPSMTTQDGQKQRKKKQTLHKMLVKHYTKLTYRMEHNTLLVSGNQLNLLQNVVLQYRNTAPSNTNSLRCPRVNNESLGIL